MIETVKSELKSKKDIAAEYGIPADTLPIILKDKDNI